MNLLLLVLSIFLHFIVFVLLIFLYQDVRRLKEERQELYGMREDMEELLAFYVEELKKENEQLKNMYEKKEKREEKEKSFTERLNDSKETLSLSTETEASYTPPLPKEEEERKDTFQPSLQAQVLSLFKEGLREDEIAKQLDIGKGEVELFLKLYKNDS